MFNYFIKFVPIKFLAGNETPRQNIFRKRAIVSRAADRYHSFLLNTKHLRMKLMTSKYSEPSVSIALLLLRVVSGSAMLMNHGLKKLSNFNAIISKGFADPFHIGAKASLGLTIFAEVFCAGLIIIGLLTRLASLPLIIAMIVALFFAHSGDLYGEGELSGVFLTVFVVLFLVGPGKFSLDRKIGK